MTDKRPTPDETAGKSRRKRATPTIDLKATEVKAKPAAGADPGAKPPVQEPPANKPAAPEPQKKDPPLKEPPKDWGKEPIKEPPKESIRPQASKSQSSETILNASAQKTGGGAGHSGTAIAAGIAGAFVMSLVFAGLWFAGFVTPGGNGSNAAGTRVAALEKQVQELQSRPAPVADKTDDKTIDALKARVAELNVTIRNLPSGNGGLAERVAAADNAMKSLGVALTALNQRNEEVAGKAAQAQQRADAAQKAVSDLRAGLSDVSKTASAGASSAELQSLQQRIAALEQAAKSAQTQIETATASDKSARLALSAAALRDAVLRGAPFADELAQAKSLGADEKFSEPLTKFAATGVPNDRTLAQELRTLLPALQKAAGSPAPSGGFLERLQANAENLVRVRPLDAPPGDDASAILARIEIEAARDDIAAALDDLGKLPDKMRAPAQDWIAKARSRQTALTAARQLAADAARALGPR